MIGVDIIDLTYPGNFKKHSFEDYTSRILDFSELTVCSDIGDLILVWCIKESIYKSWCNGGGKQFYNPKHIQIKSLDASLQTFVGNIGGSAFYGKFSLNTGTVVSIATPGSGDLEKIKLYLAETNCQLQESAFLFGNHSHAQWNICQQPVNRVDVGSASYFYSRSHHGKWYASVILPVA